ncbi:MAG TPA: hypothetical protein GXZ60_16320 [Intrasporangiaceae bacterium]|nr:hypothetical protein [Intrasporangiaceae bacterium]
MSPLDLLRRVGTSAGESADDAEHTSLAGAVLRGTGAALLTLVPVIVLASVLWLTTADPSLTWPKSALAGTGFWLLGHGIPLTLPTGVLGIVPLAALLGILLVGVWSAGRTTWAAAADGYRPALRVALAWAGGYGLVMAVAGGLATAGPLHPHLARLVLAVLMLPVVMALIGMVRSLDHDDVDEFLERCFVPAAVRRGWRPALHTTAVIVAAGTLAAVVVIGWSFTEVMALQRELRPGVAGGVVLALLQVLALPNIGLWITSFVAGPGFSIVDGAAVTWDGSSTALVPMIPVLAAHPDTADFPSQTPFVAAALVVLGSWLGWQSLAATARLASLWAKFFTVISAAVSVGAIIAVLDWIGGGSLGLDRLADLGAPAGLLGLTVTGWLLLGAAPVLLWDWRTLDR